MPFLDSAVSQAKKEHPREQVLSLKPTLKESSKMLDGLNIIITKEGFLKPATKH